MIPTMEEATRFVVASAYGWGVAGACFLALTVWLFKVVRRTPFQDEYGAKPEAFMIGIAFGMCALVTLLAACFVFDGFMNTSLNAKRTIAEIEGLRNVQRIKETH